VPAQRSLIGMLVAVAAGYAMIRHARRMLHEGVGLEDGGGWTAVVVTEFVIAMSGVALALH